MPCSFIAGTSELQLYVVCPNSHSRHSNNVVILIKNIGKLRLVFQNCYAQGESRLKHRLDDRFSSVKKISNFDLVLSLVLEC